MQVPDDVVDIGLRLRQLAPGFLEHAADEVLAADPTVVGFTTTFSQTVPSLALATLLKARRPDLTTVFGGANCDGELGRSLHQQFDVVDVVVRGEAEPSFVELCTDLLAGRPVRPLPGVLAPGAPEDGMAPLAAPASSSAAVIAGAPAPLYDEYFARLARSPAQVQAHVAPRTRLVVETARGCWWGERKHCTFCGLNGSSMSFRAKPAAKVLDEVTELARRYHRTDFDVVDNILDPTFFEDVLPELAARRRAGYDFRFFYETKANLTPTHVRRLRDAGVHRIQPGIESLSTPILRRMGKGVTALQNVRLLVFAARDGLTVTWNIIYGIPGETREDYEAMADLVPSLTHVKPPGLVPLQVHRFSPYFDDPEGNGLRLTGPAEYFRHFHEVAPDRLDGLAYAFEHEYISGHDPEAAVAPLREALRDWDKWWVPGSYRSLRYERGPAYVRLRDRRTGTPSRDVMLGELEADIYLACLTGATPALVAERIHRDHEVAIDPAEVRGFLNELTGARFLFREGDWFLALALPLTADADPPAVPGPRRTRSVPVAIAATPSRSPASSPVPT
jgi:ribosomal peptide maturation radical SAM protein 1